MPLENTLGFTDHRNDRFLYMKGIDARYPYEGYHIFVQKSDSQVTRGTHEILS